MGLVHALALAHAISDAIPTTDATTFATTFASSFASHLWNLGFMECLLGVLRQRYTHANPQWQLRALLRV